ncbi:MAG: ParA family protein [Thermofilum sp.]
MSSSAKTVSFISASGGVGKTTLSAYLAMWLLENKRVTSSRLLLVDLDPTAGLSLSLMREEEYQQSVDEKRSLVELYESFFTRGVASANIEDFVTKVKHGGEYWLNILVPGEELDRMVDELWRPGNPGPSFRRLMERSGVYARYDYVIFDSAPFFDARYTVLSLYAASRYVVVLRPSLVDFRRTTRMLGRLMKHYLNDFGLSTGEFLGRFMGVFNLVRRSREADALLAKGFRGVASARSKQDERTSDLRSYVDTLENLINVSKSLIPLSAEISRLELKELEKESRKSLEEALSDIFKHINM